MRRKPHITAALLLLLILAPLSPALGQERKAAPGLNSSLPEQATIATNTSATKTKVGQPLYTYTLAQDGTQASYDEAMAVASLQGIINRTSPELYVLSRTNTRPQFWLDLLAKDGRWLQGRERKPQPDLSALVKLAGKRLKGAIIWDPAVPASPNVATTLAGVHDVVVLSPELADRYLAKWRLPVLKDLRGMFTGSETGSRKNDAYRWALREYLAKGLCSSRRLCLFEDRSEEHTSEL